MRLLVLAVLFLAGVAAVFYFSWIPQPRLGLSGYVPAWISHWADKDANMNVRTAVPFVFLGCVTAIWLHRTRQTRYVWFAAWLGLMSLVVLAEAGQLVLPLRHFDWADIAWGVAGSTGGILFSTLLIKLTRLSQPAP